MATLSDERRRSLHERSRVIALWILFIMSAAATLAAVFREPDFHYYFHRSLTCRCIMGPSEELLAFCPVGNDCHLALDFSR